MGSGVMDFRIADTFADSLACLTGEEQKAVKTAAMSQSVRCTWPKGWSFAPSW